MSVQTKSWIQPSISACNIDVEGQNFYARERVLDEPYILICSDYSGDETSVGGPSEADLIPYECVRSSGVLDFWDEEGEDIYTFKDGQPV